jgi:hypothetical protein
MGRGGWHTAVRCEGGVGQRGGREARHGWQRPGYDARGRRTTGEGGADQSAPLQSRAAVV